MRVLRWFLHFVRDLSQDMKIRQKIITIYLVGGLVPMLILVTYLMNGTKNILIEQTRASENTELSLLSDRMEEIMRMISDVSLRMYFDEELEYIAMHQFTDYSELVDCYRNYKNISNYMGYYYKEIANIRIYIENDTISSNTHFYKVDDNIRKQDWYQEALQQNGNAVWVYIYDDVTSKYYLCLARLINTSKNIPVGVLTIAVKNELLEPMISSRHNATFIIINDNKIIASNRNDAETEAIYNFLADYRDNRMERVIYDEEECSLTVADIRYPYNKFRGSVLSLQSYNEILKDANQRNREGLTLIFISVCISCLLIFIFSDRFSARVKIFHKQMHKAALGDFRIPVRLEGKDEIGELYHDLYIMIDSIKKLDAAVYQEKLQTEKLNSRQKDVEFKMLASQINPHFLFNTLETIRMKARSNRQSEIEDLVKMLARIIRRYIEVGDKVVPLESELELVRYYLKIQQYRFGDKVSFCIEKNCTIDSYKVLPLLIQPIVENAFVHGVELKEGNGQIDITIEEQDKLYIYVKDNGVGIEEDKLKALKENLNNPELLNNNSIGLCNVNQRIKLFYGISYGINIESRINEGTTVAIALPLLGEKEVHGVSGTDR